LLRKIHLPHQMEAMVCLVINENNIKAPLVRGAGLPQARLRGSKNKIQL